MKRASIAAVAALMASTLFTGAASADPPSDIGFSVTFVDQNPCTGLPHEITINLAISFHDHDGRFVAHAHRTGTTTSGYVMDHGVSITQGNGNVMVNTLTDTWRRTDGSMFQAKNVQVIDTRTSEVRVDRFRLRCVKA